MANVHHETPGTVMILNHYRENGVIYGWDNARVDRLCRMLNINEYELGRLCCVFSAPTFGEMPGHELVSRMKKDNHWPPHVALSFALIESWLIERLTRKALGDAPVKPVIPIDLLLSSKQTEPQHD